MPSQSEHSAPQRHKPILHVSNGITIAFGFHSAGVTEGPIPWSQRMAPAPAFYPALLAAEKLNWDRLA
jgi:hypothetical protein